MTSEQSIDAKKTEADRFRKAVEAYLASYRTGDLEGRLTLFADTASFEDPVGTPAMIGHDALRAFFQSHLDLGIKFEPNLERLICCGKEALFVFTMNLIMEDGSRPSLLVHEIMTLDDHGKIASLRAFWDESSMSVG